MKKEVTWLKVAKFGGTSLADAAQIKKVCDIVLADPERRFVVVSAPGKRFSSDTKVTDLLIACGTARLNGEDYTPVLNSIMGRYIQIAQELGIPHVSGAICDDLAARIRSDIADKNRYMDLIKAAGEDNCAKLTAAYLASLGARAEYVNPGDAGLILSGDFGNASVLDESYDNLSQLRDRKGIVVFPGFFGASKAGDVVTFPRGGSDITGSILAAAVHADLYENFTDVDYVYAVNPCLVKNPKPVLEVTYREMRELSYGGFNVYQEEALQPVYKRGIPVCIRNVNNPSCPGTRIVASRGQQDQYPVAGIASDDDFCCLYISKYLMNREIGFGRRLLQILEEESISYEHTPTGIDNMSVVFRCKYIQGEKKEKILGRIYDELHVDDAYIEEDLSLILVSGEGMKHGLGIAARAAKAISKSGANIEMISQGSSEASMVFAVRTSNCDAAVVSLYREFFEK